MRLLNGTVKSQTWVRLNLLLAPYTVPHNRLVPGESPAPGMVPGAELTLKTCIDCMGEKTCSLPKILKVRRCAVHWEQAPGIL